MTRLRTIANCMEAADRDARRAVPIRHDTFKAWRLPHGQTEAIALDTGDAATLKEALDNALTLSSAINHKDIVIVQVGDATHFHAVKRRSQPSWRFDPEKGRDVAFYRHYADELFVVKVDAFMPALRWQWTPGADVVGASS